MALPRIVALISFMSLISAQFCDSKTIFGSDDRIPIREIKDETILSLSKSIVLIADQSDFHFKNKNYYFKNPKSNQMTDYSRFSDETIIGHCTGTLISPTTILTAAHCVSMNTDTFDCKKLAFIFDYTHQNTEIFAPSQFRRCKRVIKADRELQQDYAILELNKPVLDRMPITSVINFNTFKTITNQSVYMIGHPSGRTMKYTGNAKIFGITSSQDQWRTNLDAFHGNSGGPVFDTRSNQIIGILTSGTGADFKYDNDALYDAVSEMDPPQEGLGTFVTPLELIFQ